MRAGDTPFHPSAGGSARGPGDGPAGAPAPGPATGRAALASIDLQAPAAAVWDLVADVRNHQRWIPLTRVDAAPSLGVGDTFVAVTGPRTTRTTRTTRATRGTRAARGGREGRGGRGLRDSMTVVRSDPPTATAPGVGVYRKTGPVLLGEATVHVRPMGPASCTLIWTEAVHLRGLPRRLTAPVLRVPTTLMLRHALGRIRAELEGR